MLLLEQETQPLCLRYGHVNAPHFVDVEMGARRHKTNDARDKTQASIFAMIRSAAPTTQPFAT